MTDARDLDFQAYRRAEFAINGLIRGEKFNSRSAVDRRRRAEAKLVRVQQLLGRFGNPHRGYSTIHVTGTSGKGSTSAYIAAILTASGYRVGLRTSPYLQVATEKLQIGPSLIDAHSFESLANAVLAESDRVFTSREPGKKLGYAEFWTVMSMLWFAERDVDIAVIEVGAGGRFDTTNVIEPIVSVITSVGLDHVVALGPTVADIAWHKAGIIKQGSTAVVGDVSTDALRVIEAEARNVGASVQRIAERTPPTVTTLGMPGDFQHTNAQMATTVVEELRRRGFSIPMAAIGAGISAARLPGRLERMPGAGRPEVWLDGAHNPDKIQALSIEADRLSVGGRLPVIVLGMLGAKDARAAAITLASVASAIVVTEPCVLGKRSRSAQELAAILKSTEFAGAIIVEPDASSAVRRAEQLAHDQETHILITGSMYLVGEARRRWYSDRDVVFERTSWPNGESAADSRPT